MLFPMAYSLTGDRGLVFENFMLGVVTPILGFNTILESIPYFPILELVNILKLLVVHEIIKICKDTSVTDYDRVSSSEALRVFHAQALTCAAAYA